jgi:hypothetical protein
MNTASQAKKILRKLHYAVRSATAREGYRKQYDYQLYPSCVKELLAKTGEELLRIIPIGDADVAGDFWVIPYRVISDLLVPANLTHDGRWRFHIEDQKFVLYPGGRVRRGERDMQQYYGAELPLSVGWQKLLENEFV